ncbi:hypothetical protein ANANG_G00000560, partial [Anguilla anguilla]
FPSDNYRHAQQIILHQNQDIKVCIVYFKQGVFTSSVNPYDLPYGLSSLDMGFPVFWKNVAI